jgi:hypothetical protein
MSRRAPLMIASTACLLLALLLEVGAKLWVVQKAGLPAHTPRPGTGLPGTGALDVLVLLSLVLMMLVGVGVPARVMGRIQGIVTIVVALLTFLGSLFLLFAAIALLLLMVGLLLAGPFGTMAYMALFGHFDRGGAAITIGLVMGLKLASALCLALYTLQVLKSKSIVLLLACSIGLTLVLSFLHGLAPGFLVSVTDDIGAIVALVVALLWALYYVGSGIGSVVNNLRGARLPAAVTGG